MAATGPEELLPLLKSYLKGEPQLKQLYIEHDLKYCFSNFETCKKENTISQCIPAFEQCTTNIKNDASLLKTKDGKLSRARSLAADS